MFATYCQCPFVIEQRLRSKKPTGERHDKVLPLIGCFFKAPLFDQLRKCEADVWLTSRNDLLSSSKTLLATWRQIGCSVAISFTSSDSELIESGFTGFTSGKSQYDTYGKPY